MVKIKTYEYILAGIVVSILLYGLYLSTQDVTQFEQQYVPEDGLFENLTAVFLFALSILMFWRIIKFRKGKKALWLVTHIGFLLIFLFGAGEEVSWGQRIFGIESGEFFEEQNTQGEMNFHNLEIGGVRLNTLIFSQLLSVALGFYFLIIPLLYQKYQWVKNWTNRFGLYLPHWYQSLFFLFCIVLILLIPSDKKWELLEFTFTLVLLVVALNPRNSKAIYSKV